MKKVLIMSGALAVWLVTLGVVAGTAQNREGVFDLAQFDTGRRDDDRGGSSAERERILRGFRINPVELNLRGKNPLLVGLGSYLVNTGGCNDCHTNPPFAPGGNPFQGEPEQINTAGFLGGGMQFGPNLVSPNLTPDASGRPAGLTFQQFEQALRTGVDHPTVG
jgi:hypothetical protein